MMTFLFSISSRHSWSNTKFLSLKGDSSRILENLQTPIIFYTKPRMKLLSEVFLSVSAFQMEVFWKGVSKSEDRTLRCTCVYYLNKIVSIVGVNALLMSLLPTAA
ncbi:hypothetical protein QQG55_41445 [Brugia pahangi]